MAAVLTEEVGAGSSTDGDFSEQQNQCMSGEALAEWRSSEQLENGIPSTSPPFWDSDDEEDGGPMPTELYGKYTWKIDKFSQINKRELRSNPFEVGGYKWYILIYPQGCDVCNHLSLFLCVANHDKLLPGWSHFAQFTIAVVNKDPKKSKYSDTLHRFWKKEHDWGWKKFMELSKVFDGFLDSDTLVIKAQVQVIRERADRPFRCLDCHYRRELIRVYLTNVEQICRRFVEERRSKLGKLIEDRVRWSSFCAFWVSMDCRSRHHMSQEKTESILKVVVKHFFIEKEVTSTLVMDSLYSGLKALEGHYKEKKSKSKYLESEDFFVPIIRMEKDMFVLVNDVLLLLERATTEPLPPKDEKGPQNRTKDGATGEEFNKDCIQRDERRLTELGRRTIEIFILAHIFSKIEVAYQESVALKKQEELIREEEAAWLAETQQKSRRGLIDKEKKSKKKQGKQKRNIRKGKDRGKDDNSSSVVQAEIEQNESITESKDLIVYNKDMNLEKSIATVDVYDVSDSLDCVTGRLPPDSEDMAVEKSLGTEDVSDVSDSVYCAPERLTTYAGDYAGGSVSWGGMPEAHPPAEASSSEVSSLSSMTSKSERKCSAILDDSLSNSSSDSIPSLSQESNSPQYKNKNSPRRVRSHKLKQNIDSTRRLNENNSHKSGAWHGPVYSKDVVRTSKGVEIVPPIAAHPSHNILADGLEHPSIKEEEDSCFQSNLCGNDSDAKAFEDTFRSPSKETPSVANEKLSLKIDVGSSLVRKKLSSDSPNQSQISVSPAKSVENVTTLKATAHKSATPETVTLKVNAQNPAILKVSERITWDRVTTDKLTMSPVPVVSRPYSAPLVPSSRVVVSTPSLVPTSPVLSRSASIAGRFGPESCSSVTQSYVPLSYRNAIAAGPVNGTSSAYSSSATYLQAAPFVSVPPFAMMNHASPHPIWLDSGQRDGIRNLPVNVTSSSSELQNFDLYGIQNRMLSHQNYVSPEEFPHLDIINDLLDDENTSISSSEYHSFRNEHNRQPPPTLVGQHYGFSGATISSSYSSGPSNGVRRFERARSFSDDRFQYSYPYASTHSHSNGQVIPTKWQVSSSENPFVSVRSTENAGYMYHLPEYQNAAGNFGFPVYRPPNGL